MTTDGPPEEPLAPEVFDVQAALDAVPLHVVLSDDVDPHSPDPALVQETGRRRCVARKKAGGRCTVGAMHSHILCAVHSGVLDPSAGGRATAKKHAEQRVTEEEKLRLARLGARGAIAEAAAARASDLQRVFGVLVDAAMTGDLQAAKLVGPYLNQGLGMPTERVETSTPTGVADLASMPSEQLGAYVQELRQRRLQAVPSQDDEDALQAS